MPFRTNVELVEHLIRCGYLKSEKVIDAFKRSDRKLFVPERYGNYAYSDQPLSIGFGQTISAPHMVAIMTELLEPRKTDRVLEVGSGSGYQAAVLSCLVKIIYTIELEQGLIDFAESNLEKAGVKNVKIIQGDGSKGYPDAAPYDKIIVTCAAPEIPEPLVEQLKEGGIILLPVGGSFHQELIMERKVKGRLERRSCGGCIFVPLRH
jgi:protein-L-isoaspartate(D-aspartate) O-methyltransferase